MKVIQKLLSKGRSKLIDSYRTRRRKILRRWKQQVYIAALYLGVSDGPLPLADIAALILFGLCISDYHDSYGEATFGDEGLGK